MSEAAAGEDDRQIPRVVLVGVGEVRAVEHGRVVEERATGLSDPLHRAEQPVERSEEHRLDHLQLCDLRLVAAVVGEPVDLVGDPIHVRPHVDLAEADRHDAGAVGLEGEPGHVVHEVRGLLHLLVLDVRGLCHLDGRLGPPLPGLALDQRLLHVADRTKELLDPLAVAAAGPPAESAGIVANEVEDAPAAFQFGDPLLRLGRGALHEELAIDRRGAPDHRHLDAAAEDRRRAGADRADEQGERGKPRLAADLLGDQLVDGDRVLEVARRGLRGAAQEGPRGAVAVGVVQMGEAAEDGHPAPVGRDDVEVGRRFVVRSRGLRKEIARQHAHVGHDAEHPLWGHARGRRSAGGRFEPRQCNGHAGGTEELAAAGHGGIPEAGRAVRPLCSRLHRVYHACSASGIIRSL